MRTAAPVGIQLPHEAIGVGAHWPNQASGFAIAIICLIKGATKIRFSAFRSFSTYFAGDEFVPEGKDHVLSG